MIDNREKNNLCFWQAQAFIDYISKLKIRSKDDLLETFCHWADSKDFLEKDAKCIQRLVEEFWQGEKNEVAESKRKKRCSKNKVVEEDKRQMYFEFLSKPQ